MEEDNIGSQGVEFTRVRILMLALVTEGSALLIALFLADYFEINLFPLTDNLLRDIISGTAAAVIPFIFFLYIISDKAEKFSFLHSVRKTVKFDIKTIFSNTRLPDLFIISLLAGLCEEILFRGVIQVKFGILIASIVFGLIHFVSLAYVVITILMGLYIGALYHISGSLLVPVYMHFLYDFCALVYVRYFVRDENMN